MSSYLSTPHVDIIRNEWAAGRQVLMERIPPTDPRANLEGDYLFASKPHYSHECPFLGVTELPLIPYAARPDDEGGEAT